jgi:hypothetical protein
VLALDALRLRRALAERDRRPEPWPEPRFAREVELIRCHLSPLKTRRTLTASFGREAFQGLEDDRVSPPIGATRAAYAIRWLELGAGASLPTWSVLLDEAPGRR